MTTIYLGNTNSIGSGTDSGSERGEFITRNNFFNKDLSLIFERFKEAKGIDELKLR